MIKKWIPRSEKIEKEKIKEVAQKNNISEILAELVLKRDINKDEIEQFLEPKRENLLKYIDFPDLDRAVSRIIQAIEKNEKILIYGDYDVDGICATSLLVKYLKNFTKNIDFFIPDRQKHGYGLNKNVIDNLKNSFDLIITVDCGITNFEEIKSLNNFGIDVIVTDHHEPKEKLPDAYALLDLKILDKSFNALCGCGVALKLIFSLEDILKSKINLDEYIQLTMLATVCDVVDLKKENRDIVKIGLELTNKYGFKNKGLNNLVHLLDLNQIKASDLSFRIGPVLNAAGRIGNANAVVKFLTGQIKKPSEFAEKLIELNQKRALIQEKILKEARRQAKKQKDDYFIILNNPNWHPGIIGIVASKIAEEFHRPTILISTNDQPAKGSGRSIRGINLFKALESAKEFLINFGGHSLAAGLTIQKENIPEFKKALEKFGKEQIDVNVYTPIEYFDSLIEVNQVSLNLAKDLIKLEPFGVANPEPVFKLRERVDQTYRIGKDKKHIRFRIKNYDGVFFNAPEELEDGFNERVDLLAKVGLNCYNNTHKVEFKVKDLKQNPFTSFKYAQKILREIKTADDLIIALEGYSKPKLVDRKVLVNFYNLIKRAQTRGFNLKAFLNNKGFNMFESVMALELLQNIGLISYSYQNGIIKAKINKNSFFEDIFNQPLAQLIKKAEEKVAHGF